MTGTTGTTETTWTTKTTRTPTTGTSGITGKTIIASASTTVVGDHLKLGVVNGTSKNVALGKF